MRSFLVVLAAASLAFIGVVARPAAAQARSAEVGIASRLTGLDGDEPLVGFRISGIGRSVGMDFAVAIFPFAALASGEFHGIVDLDLVAPVHLGEHASLLPRVGGTMLVGPGSGIGGVVPGLNGGVGFLARFSPRAGLRGDYTLRRVYFHGAWLDHSNFTFGFVWIRFKQSG